MVVEVVLDVFVLVVDVLVVHSLSFTAEVSWQCHDCDPPLPAQLCAVMSCTLSPNRSSK